MTKVISKDCSADSSALFQHCINIYIGNTFYSFFVHDYRSGVQFVQVTSCAINTVEHWGELSEEVSTTHMFRP